EDRHDHDQPDRRPDRAAAAAARPRRGRAARRHRAGPAGHRPGAGRRHPGAGLVRQRQPRRHLSRRGPGPVRGGRRRTTHLYPRRPDDRAPDRRGRARYLRHLLPDRDSLCPLAAD
ncbi:MAG: hypothetical protein AVDCRST_MAG33-2879, partial [uncultured Thermomicrobiales bacterium]